MFEGVTPSNLRVLLAMPRPDFDAPATRAVLEQLTTAELDDLILYLEQLDRDTRHVALLAGHVGASRRRRGADA